MFHSDLWSYLVSIVKLFDIFDKFTPSNFKQKFFDLKLSLEFSSFPKGPWTSQKIAFSSYKKRDFTLIKSIWYVKLCENHCQICDAKSS